MVAIISAIVPLCGCDDGITSSSMTGSVARQAGTPVLSFDPNLILEEA